MHQSRETISIPHESDLSIEIIRSSSGKEETCVNGKVFSNFVVDIGGAPLVNALNLLAEPENGVMIIDPVAMQLGPELVQALIDENYSEIPSILTRGPISEKDLENRVWAQEKIAQMYQQLISSMNEQEWTERIFFSGKPIDKFLFPFADLVTCYYPIPLEDSPMCSEYIIQSGMNILKPNGLMRVVTESMYWVRSAGEFFESDVSERFQYTRSVLPFNPNVVPEVPLSLSDLAYIHRPSIVFEIRHNNKI